jgi:hypothetical protein
MWKGLGDHSLLELQQLTVNHGSLIENINRLSPSSEIKSGALVRRSIDRRNGPDCHSPNGSSDISSTHTQLSPAEQG